MGYAYLTPFARSFIVIECAALFRNCDLRIGRERRVSDRAAQKTEGLFERAIVLFVGRHIGLRARFFGTFGLEMASAATPHPRYRYAPSDRGHFLQQLYVWLDAFRLDGTTGRCEITCRGQPQRPITRSERHDRLHRPFAKGARADQRRL